MYYSKLKIIHHKEKMDTLTPDTRITPPVHVRIKPTNRCNHSCWYCSYQNSYGQLGKDMKWQDQIPFAKLKEIMDDCADMGVKAVTFSGGGEPLLYPRISEIIRMAKVKLAVLTNGTTLKGSIADALREKASWVRISIDGWDGKSYAKYRGCGGQEFKRVCDNIKSFTSEKSGCVLGVNIIVDKANVGHLADMVDLFASLRVDNIKLGPAIISNHAQKNNAYHAKLEGKFQSQLAKITFKNLYNSYHSQLEGFEKDYTWCPYIQILPIIGADCKVYACHDKAYNMTDGVIGDISKTRFKYFWYAGKTKFYKINPAVSCNHHCVTDKTNKLILEYLAAEHREFV